MAHIVHELIHAAGIEGHPDPDVYAESVLAYSFLWNPGDVLFPIDRDVLAASHTVTRRGGRLGCSGTRILLFKIPNSKLTAKAQRYFDTLTQYPSCALLST